MKHPLFLPDSEHAFGLASQAEMSGFDAQTIGGGVPALTLMERAGRAVVKHVESLLRGASGGSSSPVILCGPGNNGGDGLVVGRLLLERGAAPSVFVASAKNYSSEFIAQAEMFLQKGGEIHCIGDCSGVPEVTPVSPGEVITRLERAGVVVDALLGTGQRDQPRGGVVELMHCVASVRERSSFSVIAVDLPSGVNGDTGEVYQEHIAADRTVCIEMLKRGMVQFPARTVCGVINVEPIGLECGEVEYSLITHSTLSGLESRRSDTHKGTYGRILVIGGCAAMPGAPALTALGALRAGAGLVVKAQLEGVQSVGDQAEVMLALLSNEEGCYSPAHLSELGAELSACDCVAVGPGLGKEKLTLSFLRDLLGDLAERALPVVVDADALNIISDTGGLTSYREFLSRAVLTPHPGEASRLLGIELKEVQRDRYLSARRLAEESGSVVVLKGTSSVLYHGQKGGVNSSGNAYMATGGSGDVLTGIIAALIGQGFSTWEATRYGVYLHGRAGDINYQHRQGPMIASDIAARIPEAWAELAMRGAGPRP